VEKAAPVRWQFSFTRGPHTRSVESVGASVWNSSPRQVETGMHTSDGVIVAVVVAVVVCVVVVGVVVAVVV
jgi:hypothetical protein